MTAIDRRTARRSISSLPPHAQLVAQKLARHGWPEGTWLFFEDYPLPDPGQALQVRDETSLAPKGNIALYAENMRNGDLFPPIVSTRDGIEIDGLTRNLAKRRITPKGQVPVFDAFILQEDAQDATIAQRDRLYILGAVLNRHGEKLSDKNVENVIRQVWHKDMVQTDLARLLGVTANTVKLVVNAMTAEKRLAELGVDTSTLSKTVLGDLHTKGGKMYDGPFLKAAQIFVAARFTGPEARELLKELGELHTQEQQMELLTGVEQARRLQIDGVVRSNPLATQAMRHLKFFANHHDDYSALAETLGPEAQQAMIERGWLVVGVLRKLLTEMENKLGEGRR